MGKKSKSLPYIYLIGMALAVIGFCCPMIKGLFGTSANGFKFINFDNSTFVTIGALLIFIGAVAGLVACFVPQLSGLKLIFLLASIAGGVILVVGFLTNGGIYKAVGKGLIKKSMFGLWMVVAGWVVALVGYFKD